MAKGSDFFNNVLKNRQKMSGRKAIGQDKLKMPTGNQSDEPQKKGLGNMMKNASRTAVNIGNKLKNIVGGITKLVNILISLFSSPVTWVIVALIFLWLVFQSGMNILGQSDYAWNCDGQSGTAIASGGASNTKYSLEEVSKWATAPVSSTWGISDATAEKWFLQQPNSAGYKSALGLTPSVMSNVSHTLRKEGVSPVIIYMYAINEGYANMGWINNRTQNRNTDPIHDAKVDADKLLETANTTGRQTAAGEGDVPNFNKAPVEDWIAHMPKGSIGRAYPILTAATAAEVGILLGTYKYPAGAKPFGMNFENMMNDIKAMHGDLKNPQPFKTSDSGGSDDGSVSDCSQQTGDTSSIVAFAKSLVVPASEGNVSSDPNGWDRASAAYRAAYQKVGGPMSGGVGKLLASCDSFVATVLRNTVDKSFPWHNTVAQEAYVKKNKHYKKIKCGEQQPGDFAFGMSSPGGGVEHVFIIANKDATEAYAASYHDHVGIDDKTSRYGGSGMLSGCTGDYLNGGDGHRYGEIWRYVG